MQALFERELFGEIKPYLFDHEVIVIHGARQVGKTSLMQYIMRELEKTKQKSMLYLDLEDPAHLETVNRGVEEVVQHIQAKGYDLSKLFYLFIDEIQHMDNPSSFLKLLHDRYKRQIKAIVTGSSTFAIKSKFKDSLVGRIVDFELFPLSFKEHLRFKKLDFDLDVDPLPASIHRELSILYKDFVIKGGYPAITIETAIEKQERALKQITTTYIKTDIRDIGKIRNLQKFNQLLQILASQTGKLMNIHELSNTVGIARPTLEEYLFILENTYVIKRVSPFFKNIRNELSRMPKLYFEDTGIASILENKSFLPGITGSLFENSIFGELRKQIGSEKIHFWRTTAQQEIDFIIQSHPLIPVEVKTTLRQKDLHALKYFMKKYSLKKAYICTLEKRDGALSKEIEAIHPWELMKAMRQQGVQR